MLTLSTKIYLPQYLLSYTRYPVFSRKFEAYEKARENTPKKQNYIQNHPRYGTNVGTLRQGI